MEGQICNENGKLDEFHLGDASLGCTGGERASGDGEGVVSLWLVTKVVGKDKVI